MNFSSGTENAYVEQENAKLMQCIKSSHDMLREYSESHVSFYRGFTSLKLILYSTETIHFFSGYQMKLKVSESSSKHRVHCEKLPYQES